MAMTDLIAKARAAVDSLMTGTCTVKRYTSSTDATTHVTSNTLGNIYTNKPCRLSYSKAPATADGDAPGVLLTVKLFLPPELTIKAGDVFVVTQAGKTETFEAASDPAMYVNHQEVELERSEKYA